MFKQPPLIVSWKRQRRARLTLDQRVVLSGGVDAQGAEEAFHLQDKDERSPAEHDAAEAQALQQASGQSEALSHPHGDTHLWTQRHKKPTHFKCFELLEQHSPQCNRQIYKEKDNS